MSAVSSVAEQLLERYYTAVGIQADRFELEVELPGERCRRYPRTRDRTELERLAQRAAGDIWQVGTKSIGVDRHHVIAAQRDVIDGLAQLIQHCIRPL